MTNLRVVLVIMTGTALAMGNPVGEDEVKSQPKARSIYRNEELTELDLHSPRIIVNNNNNELQELEREKKSTVTSLCLEIHHPENPPPKECDPTVPIVVHEHHQHHEIHEAPPKIQESSVVWIPTCDTPQQPAGIPCIPQFSYVPSKQPSISYLPPPQAPLISYLPVPAQPPASINPCPPYAATNPAPSKRLFGHKHHHLFGKSAEPMDESMPIPMDLQRPNDDIINVVDPKSYMLRQQIPVIDDPPKEEYSARAYLRNAGLSPQAALVPNGNQMQMIDSSVQTQEAANQQHQAQEAANQQYRAAQQAASQQHQAQEAADQAQEAAHQAQAAAHQAQEAANQQYRTALRQYQIQQKPADAPCASGLGQAATASKAATAVMTSGPSAPMLPMNMPPMTADMTAARTYVYRVPSAISDQLMAQELNQQQQMNQQLINQQTLPLSPMSSMTHSGKAVTAVTTSGPSAPMLPMNMPPMTADMTAARTYVYRVPSAISDQLIAQGLNQQQQMSQQPINQQTLPLSPISSMARYQQYQQSLQQPSAPSEGYQTLYRQYDPHSQTPGFQMPQTANSYQSWNKPMSRQQREQSKDDAPTASEAMKEKLENAENGPSTKSQSPSDMLTRMKEMNQELSKNRSDSEKNGMGMPVNLKISSPGAKIIVGDSKSENEQTSTMKNLTETK